MSDLSDKFDHDDQKNSSENTEKNTHQETVALSPEDMGIDSFSNGHNSASTKQERDDDEEKNHQETIAMTAEELGIHSPKKDNGDHQETIAMTAEELGIHSPKKDNGDHQETIAMTAEELGIHSPKKDNGDHQETIAMTPEEIGVKPDPPQKDHQETVVLSPEELGLKPSLEDMRHQETLAISLDDLGMNLSGCKTSDLPSFLDETDELSNFDATPYARSDLEEKYYLNWVQKRYSGNKYSLEQKLVSGGMGAILKAVDRYLQRVSAMKVILPTLKEKENTLIGFIREAKITGLLEHPNIIPVHELGLLEETGLFFTMKLANGEALNDIIENLRSENTEYAEKYNTYLMLNIFRKVCDALSFAHSLNIIHQDIKPHNIMVGEYGEVLLMDWGLALYIGNPEQEKDPVIKQFMRDIVEFSKGEQNLIKGSPVYMAPEQVYGNPAFLDTRTDIFLLGATLYHMFTLEPPYFGANIREIAQKAKERDLIPPSQRNPGRQIPEEICRIIMKSMAASKEERYQTVEEMAQDIDDLLAGKWSQEEKKFFKAGEFLMKEGETGEEAYLILDGRVQVVKETGGQKIVLGELKEGDMVGEMSLITKESRSASVEAVEDTEAAVLTKHLVTENLNKLPPYMGKIVSTLTERLRAANANIHPHLTSDPTWVVLKQMRMIINERTRNDPQAGVIPFKEIVQEISGDLGIPKIRIRKIISKISKEDFINVKNHMIHVLDMEALTRYTNQIKMRM